MIWTALLDDGTTAQQYLPMYKEGLLIEGIEKWLETFQEEKDSFWDDIPF
jgi:hypothetical protein